MTPLFEKPQRRTLIIPVRATPGEKRALEAAAAKRGITVADLTRLAWAKITEEDDA